MNIELNNTEIEKAINENMTEAINHSLSSYDVRQAVSSRITDSVANGVIKESLDKALLNIDTDALTKHLAEQIQKSMTKAVSMILRQGLCSTMMQLSDIPSYEKEARERKEAELMQMIKTD